jgi:hypothetical protein
MEERGGGGGGASVTTVVAVGAWFPLREQFVLVFVWIPLCPLVTCCH